MKSAKGMKNRHNKEVDATPKEEEAIQRILEKANTKQVGGEHYKDKHIQPWDAIHEWGSSAVTWSSTLRGIVRRMA